MQSIYLYSIIQNNFQIHWWEYQVDSLQRNKQRSQIALKPDLMMFIDSDWWKLDVHLYIPKGSIEQPQGY